MISRFILLSLLSMMSVLSSCGQKNTPAPPLQPLIKGADISWISEMEAAGKKFYTTNGVERDPVLLMKDLGMNAIRLRVWVNPANGWNGLQDVIQKAMRVKQAGLKLLIDFHYSDSWADPGKQNPPAAWAGLGVGALCDSVRAHTTRVLSALLLRGVTPEWVQIGNEIPGGLLWPDGCTHNWKQLGQLLNKGYEATKAVNPKIKVIVHVDEGNNIEKFNAFFDHVTQEKVNYDVIGLSYYPFWIKKDYTETIADLETNLINLSKKYNKEVMVVEVGGEVSKVENTFKLLEATINAVRKVPNNKGLGVLYWEPQGIASWSHYSLNAWLENGQPSPALQAFKK